MRRIGAVLCFLTLHIVNLHAERNVSHLKCESRTMREVALSMVALSGPKESSLPWQKSLSILKSSNKFHVLLNADIFKTILITLEQLVEGFGQGIELERVSFNKFNVGKKNFVIENSYFGGVRNLTKCQHSNCIRIILQSEQLHSNKGFLLRSYLQECHSSSQCVIWDFSDYNYQWAVKNRLQDSFLLLPIMNQFRFHLEVEKQKQWWSYLHSHPKKKHNLNVKKHIQLSSRPLDVVLFGLMNGRRLDVKNEIERRHPSWKIDMRQLTDTKDLIPLYQQAKICLTVHSYGEESGGEYHRLTETALFGCVEIMETFADKIGKDTYTECGGVIFTTYDKMIDTIAAVLTDINLHSAIWEKRQQQVVGWWVQNWQWATGFFRQEE